MESIKKNIKYIIFIIISIILILLLSYYALSVSEVLYLKVNKKSHEEYKDSIENIKENTIIMQEFKAKHNNLEKIKINFNDNEHTGSGKLILTLKDLSNDNIIKTEEVEYIRNDREKNRRYSNIGSDLEYEFKFDRQANSKGKKYSISIQYLNINNEAYDENTEPINLEFSKNNISKNRNLYINGQLTTGNINIEEMYYNNIRTKIFNVTVLICLILIGIMVTFILKLKLITPERIFLFTMPILCCLFIIFIPMFKGHDEQRHWLRAYEISEGHFITEINDGIVGTRLPKSVIEGIKGLDWSEIKYSDIVEEINKELNPEDKSIKQMNNVAVYSPVQYIPQAIGIFIARLFTNKVLIMAYAARVLNALICGLILYYAIKKMPFGKNIMLLCVYIPILLEGICTMSADGITISISFLFVAYILNLINDKEKIINRKDILVLTILSVVIAFCKIVYLPLIGLLLLIPKDKFKNYKNKTLVILAIWIIAVTCSLLWLGVANKYLALQTAGSSTSKIMNILQHPIQYIQILIYTMNSDGQSHLMSLFGGRMTWSSISLIFIVPYTLFILFLILSTTERDIKQKINMFSKTIVILVILAIAVLIYTSLYMHWTDDGAVKISGVQGRYYLPILPLLGIFIGNCIKAENKYDEKEILKFISIIGIIIEFYAILTILIPHLG